MSADKPSWWQQTNEFCHARGIKIMAWGPDLLTVEAKSPERAKEIAAQLADLGFKVIESEDNALAGMLDLSQNPAAIIAKTEAFDRSHKRFRWR